MLNGEFGRGVGSVKSHEDRMVVPVQSSSSSRLGCLNSNDTTNNSISGVDGTSKVN